MNDTNTKKTQPRLRFAPSPTGGLHIGTARTALFNWLAAESMKGKLILRIEDTDKQRSKKVFEDLIIEDLKWLGFKWDEFYRQSDRLKIYQEYAARLLNEGKAYRCFCSQERLENLQKKQYEQGKDSKYDRKCCDLLQKEASVYLNSGAPYAIRFKVPEREIIFNDAVRGMIKFSSEVIGDFVILKSDFTPSYNFAVVIDDADMKITHVLRGEDHITNTAKQVLLFESFNFEKPVFGHFSMILGKDGAKLSKRHGSQTINEFKNEGFLSEAVCNYLALLSWAPKDGNEIFMIDEIINHFNINDISKSPAIFDMDKLRWINGSHIRLKTAEELFEMVKPFISADKEYGFINAEDIKTRIKIIRCLDAFKDKIKVLAEFNEYIAGYFKEDKTLYGSEEENVLKEPTAFQALFSLLNLFEQESQKNTGLSAEKVYEIMDEHFFKNLLLVLADSLKDKDIKGRSLYMPARVSLTGEVHGPELPKIMAILGIDTCIKRVKLVISGFYNNGKADKIS